MDPNDLEPALAWVEWEAKTLWADPNARFLLLEEEGERTEITVETPQPLLLLHFAEIIGVEPLVGTKAEIQQAGGDVELANWQAKEHLYLSAIDDNRGEDSTGRCYVDFVTARRDYAEALREIVGAGKGKIRTRGEMLTDRQPPGLIEALRDWEAGDDSRRCEPGAMGRPRTQPASAGACRCALGNRPRTER
jgi:hypothetical protein